MRSFAPAVANLRKSQVSLQYRKSVFRFFLSLAQNYACVFPGHDIHKTCDVKYLISIIIIALLVCACDDIAIAPPPADTSPGIPLAGQIIVNPDNPAWLSYAGGGPHFLAGAGDPEDFLYRGELKSDGTRDGDQLDIIDKLRRSGANGIYFQAIRSHGGDGEKSHNPFFNHDPDQDLNYSVLDQWDLWLDALDHAGIAIYFFFYDDSALVWDTGNDVSVAERTFFEAMVNRFEHHKHLVWVIAEEYQEEYSAARISRLAAIIRAADDHVHPIGVHKNSGLDFDEFARDPNIDQFTIQYNKSNPVELHDGMVDVWQNAAQRYNLNMSEAFGHGTGKNARLKNWAVAMGGAYVMVLGMDVINSDMNDLRDLARLKDFMEATNFDEMSPRNDLATGATEYVLARPGHSYILYSSSVERGASLGVVGMSPGDYTVTYFNPVDGREVTETVVAGGGTNSWTIPDGWRGEIALYVRPSDNTGYVKLDSEDEVPESPSSGTIRTKEPKARREPSQNRAPAVRDTAIEVDRNGRITVSLTVNDPDGPGPYSFTVVNNPQHGNLSGTGNDLTYTPHDGFAGQDSLTWRASDSIATSATATIAITVRP